MNPEEASVLAQKHAPILAHKVSAEWRVADEIAPVDFAGSLQQVHRNPDRLFKLDPNNTADIKPKVYFSVCETKTHYFIIYAVYHVLDWWKRLPPDNLYDLIRDSLDEHLHDMEGALVVITRQPTEIVDAVITIAHDHYYLYTNPPPSEEGAKKLGDGTDELRIVEFSKEDIDGQIWRDAQSSRIKLYVQSKGHGIYGDTKHWGGGEEICYYRPKGETGDPRPESTISPPKLQYGKLEKGRKRDYELEDIFAPDGLWHQRFNKKVFMQNKKGKWGFVYYDKKQKRYFGGAANPPWSWNDRNDPSPIGEIATDPARLIVRYAQGWGPVSQEYVWNPYLEIE